MGTPRFDELAAAKITLDMKRRINLLKDKHYGPGDDEKFSPFMRELLEVGMKFYSVDLEERDRQLWETFMLEQIKRENNTCSYQLKHEAQMLKNNYIITLLKLKNKGPVSRQQLLEAGFNESSYCSEETHTVTSDTGVEQTWVRRWIYRSGYWYWQHEPDVIYLLRRKALAA